MQDAHGPDSQDYGHHWKDAERVRTYIEGADNRAAERARLFMLVADLASLGLDANVRILDIGSGHGPFAATLLEAFPRSKAVGLDVSEAMIVEGRSRLARFGDRFRYHPGDFADGRLPDDLSGPFDVIVSAAATHHLPSELKRTLYRSIFERTAPGGCFFNLDSMSPSDDFLRDRYHEANDRQRERAGEPAPAGGHAIPSAHFFEPVEDHLAWLTEAGFAHAHCFWKELGQALIGGFRP